MVAGILNALGIGKQKEGLKPSVIIKPGRLEPVQLSQSNNNTQSNIWKDAESLLGKEALAGINGFINKLLPFQYGSCPLKALAVPEFVYLPEYYERVMQMRPPKDGWGLYTMSADPFGNLFQKAKSSSFVLEQLDAKGGHSYGKSLGVVAGRMTKKYYRDYYFSDVRHLLRLMSHPEEIPQSMKNGKGNLFAGTTIMVNFKPCMLIAVWRDSAFEIELISLGVCLEDTAQFVMVRRQ